MAINRFLESALQKLGELGEGFIPLLTWIWNNFWRLLIGIGILILFGFLAFGKGAIAGTCKRK